MLTSPENCLICNANIDLSAKTWWYCHNDHGEIGSIGYYFLQDEVEQEKLHIITIHIKGLKYFYIYYDLKVLSCKLYSSQRQCVASFPYLEFNKENISKIIEKCKRLTTLL